MKAVIWNKSGWINETNPNNLKSLFNDALKKSGFGILKFSDHHFKPFGYSAIWLISESHFAIHTFPEENKTYWELSSCSKSKFNSFITKIKPKDL